MKTAVKSIKRRLTFFIFPHIPLKMVFPRTGSDAIQELLVMGFLLTSYTRNLRKRRALPMTDTELKLMAAAAIIGLSRMPKNG